MSGRFLNVAATTLSYCELFSSPTTAFIYCIASQSLFFNLAGEKISWDKADLGDTFTVLPEWLGPREATPEPAGNRELWWDGAELPVTPAAGSCSDSI